MILFGSDGEMAALHDLWQYRRDDIWRREAGGD